LGLTYLLIKAAAKNELGPSPRKRAIPSARFEPVIKALRDDLNFPAALGALFESLAGESPYTAGDLLSFERALWVLGLRLRSSATLEDDDGELAVAVADYTAGAKVNIPTEITALAERRSTARLAKDFKTADALRKELAAAGWSMLDGKDGYKLEPLKK
jgi:cysteinyl-tRNA synthetase